MPAYLYLCERTYNLNTLKVNDRSDALALVHQVKRFVDLVQSHCMGYKFVDQQFLVKVRLHQFWHIVDTLPAAECRSLPCSTCYQLEWPSANLSASSSYANNYRYAPALSGRFQSCAHCVHVTDTLESVIETTVLLYQNLLNRTVAIVLRVHELCASKLFGCNETIK